MRVKELQALALAIQFLTRAPIPAGTACNPARLAAAVRYYPLVGALIGAVCAGVFLLAQVWLAGPIAVLLAMAAGLAVTGAFHEDGLADTFDGIGASAAAPDRALEIMRDSRLGTYGSAALFMALGIKFAALASLAPATVWMALIAGHGLSRISSVAVMQTSRYIRETGAATELSRRPGAKGSLVVLLTGAALVAGLAAFMSPFAAIPALAGLLAGHVLMRLYCEPRLGGYTGDTLGAVQQASEIGLYLGLAAWA
ncbi:MAG: adenosylcobinamide-GDP ribazoletransferase [Gammaproteobacteria bacterium]|nr:adenosylcobinamide-GDP ribazoletransferase [Gammaproteobacteria bacterium]MYD00970.1 adenosylcobinamide-GDP ribazoletransferase [Gammaproteobacteria bacterium]MYI24520.1 adenosylcobinamide-GDP ribazoletransferase [Gammaproteobacteria bacterium]